MARGWTPGSLARETAKAKSVTASANSLPYGLTGGIPLIAPQNTGSGAFYLGGLEVYY